MKIKKILVLFILLLTIISINTFVSADMDAPMVNPYRATVTNVNGAEVRKDRIDEETEIIDYGTEVEVMYEYENIDNILYATVTIVGDEEEFNLKDIKLEDISIKEDTYIAKALRTETPIEFIVLNKNGVDIHKGPAEAYSKTGTTIPYGEEIIAYEEDSKVSSPWFFVNYNGISGWISQLDASLGTKREEVAMAFGDLYLYEINGLITEEKLDKIPSGTLFKNYIETDPWSQTNIVYYNGHVGEVYIRSLSKAYDTPLNVKVSENEAKLYLKPDTTSEVLIKSIPVGTVLSAEYTDYNDIWAYTSYDGISGFVQIEYMDYLLDEEEKIENPILPEVDESKAIDCEGKLLSYSSSENSEVIENNGKTEINEGISEKNETPVVYTLDINQLVCICLITAIIASLTSVVIINLLNKNKNSEVNKEDKKEEENKE